MLIFGFFCYIAFFGVLYSAGWLLSTFIINRRWQFNRSQGLNRLPSFFCVQHSTFESWAPPALIATPAFPPVGCRILASSVSSWELFSFRVVSHWSPARMTKLSLLRKKERDPVSNRRPHPRSKTKTDALDRSTTIGRRPPKVQSLNFAWPQCITPLLK